MKQDSDTAWPIFRFKCFQKHILMDCLPKKWGSLWPGSHVKKRFQPTLSTAQIAVHLSNFNTAPPTRWGVGCSVASWSITDGFRVSVPWGRKLANKTKRNVNKSTDVNLQWWHFNNKINISHDPLILHNNINHDFCLHFGWETSAS